MGGCQRSKAALLIDVALVSLTSSCQRDPNIVYNGVEYDTVCGSSRLPSESLGESIPAEYPGDEFPDLEARTVDGFDPEEVIAHRSPSRNPGCNTFYQPAFSIELSDARVDQLIGELERATGWNA